MMFTVLRKRPALYQGYDVLRDLSRRLYSFGPRYSDLKKAVRSYQPFGDGMKQQKCHDAARVSYISLRCTSGLCLSRVLVWFPL